MYNNATLDIHPGEETERKFWMVWSPSKQPPSVRHQSHAAAVNEARRLAATKPGHHFYVLVAEKRIELAQPMPQFKEGALQ